MTAFETFLKELDQYSIEIHGQPGILNLTDLINSHRRLRTEAMKKHEEYRREVMLAIERAKNNAYEDAFKYQYFSADRLREMKISELVDLLYVDV